MSDIHVLPVGDLVVHSETRGCPCVPRLSVQDNGTVVIHNSFDEREKYENLDTKRLDWLIDTERIGTVSLYKGEEGPNTRKHTRAALDKAMARENHSTPTPRAETPPESEEVK